MCIFRVVLVNIVFLFSSFAFGIDPTWSLKEVDYHGSHLRTGSTLIVTLDKVPKDEDALIHEVHVTWQDRDEMTEGQLYLDNFSYLFPRPVSFDPHTEIWDFIDWAARKVQLEILDASEEDAAFGARIFTIKIYYTYPIPPEEEQ
jgi:hypothetical protein